MKIPSSAIQRHWALIKSHNLEHIHYIPLMLLVKLPVVNGIHKFAMGVENKATGDSKLNDSTRVLLKI